MKKLTNLAMKLLKTREGESFTLKPLKTNKWGVCTDQYARERINVNMYFVGTDVCLDDMVRVNENDTINNDEYLEFIAQILCCCENNTNIFTEYPSLHDYDDLYFECC